MEEHHQPIDISSDKGSSRAIRCDICNTITHKIERTIFGKKRIPLTVPGKSLRGICLVCNGPDTAAVVEAEVRIQKLPPPIPINQMPTYDSAGIPNELLMKDDATVFSAITLDHRFDTPDESDDEESSGHFRVTPGQRRPEPSLGDPDEYERPAPLRKNRPDSKRSSITQNNYHPHPHNNHHPNHRVGGGGGRSHVFSQHAAAAAAAPMVHEGYQEGIMGPPPTSSASPWMMDHRRSNVYDIQEHDSPFMPSPQEEKTEIESSTEIGTLGAASWQKQPIGDYDRKQGISSTPLYRASSLDHGSNAHSLLDIPALVNSLNLSNNGGDHVVAIQSLADMVWECGQQAKISITDHNGLEGLTQSMWTSMAVASVQEAALNLIFALAASSDGLAASDVFTGKGAEAAVDALLIVMQTHLTVENIQHAGCGILACLSAATSNNSSADDASLSGAMMSVVSAMEAHRHSRGIQEWGIRALHNQCLYSRHAESNKRSLAKSGMEENKCGAAVIYRAIEITEGDDMVTVEWACRLYWCLSASEDVAVALTVTHHPIQVILEALQRYHQVAEAAGLLEAIFGTLANLVKVRENHKAVDPTVLYLVVKAAQSQHTNEDLLIEACALIANLVSLSSANAAVAVDADCIDVIFNGLQAFPENVSMFEEAMRCLTCLSVTSEDAKGYLCTRVVLSFLANMHSDSAFGQEMFVNLMGSIMTRDGPQHTIIAHGGVDMLLSAMRAHPNDRRVQEAGCLAVRNLACHSDEDMRIDFRETINCITQAMAKHESSESIQLNGCCALWNVGQMSDAIGYELSEKEMIEYIVKAMQTHMESASVLEMACAALYSKINGSPEGKRNLVESGGLDAVTCVLVMHPNEPAALEKAFGVLACMSASTDFADDVANAQCMGNVMEAMRANSSCVTLLEYGCLVLRNIILLRPEHTSDSLTVVATVLNAMREHPDAVAFQREACSLLWAMAAVSEPCKSKVLSLDGIAVLLNCLEHNSSFTDVQDAALGAFNQLSSGNSS